MVRKILFISWLMVSASPLLLQAQNHPCMMLSPESVAEIRKHLGTVPLFDLSLQQAQKEVDAAIEKGVIVPVPKDLAGGYTHEQHKQNFFLLQKAGTIFQLTGEEKYAIHIREVFMAYAEMYPKLDVHPATRSYARGKIFWQCLNDANWLVYMSQAYDCIYDWLTAAEREKLETQLFRPFADFLSIENPKFFNRIHNHSTWGNAGVGMMGIVMGDEELINRALYGLNGTLTFGEQQDNDGGFINIPGQEKAGFLANIDHAFSPDGYYTEGPYYHRYAIFPFIVFARALENYYPDKQIFSYRDSLMVNSIYALLNQTDAGGTFFPINDAQKGMSYLSRELVTAVDICYYYGGTDASLLSIAQEQGRVLLDETGFQVAQDLAKGLATPFIRTSQELSDGAKGDEGAIGILRTPQDMTLLMKYSAQGMGHGHFDKLSFSYYDGAAEVLQDYGAARWVNIDQKDGGGYLKENKSWAKQSIAHNTLVINERSHFGGEYKIANAHHSDPYVFLQLGEGVQLVSAKETNAYPGIEMHRSMLLIEDEVLEKPLLIDVFRTETSTEDSMQYDLPYYFQGHLLEASFPFAVPKNSLTKLGDGHGYQHLWLEASGKSEENVVHVNWFKEGRFYTLHSWVSPNDDLMFVRTGASDPYFNLRRDPAFIIRSNNVGDKLFISLLESHGNYSPVTEIPLNPYSKINKLELLLDQKAYSAFRFEHESGKSWIVILANQDSALSSSHTLQILETDYSWEGPLYFQPIHTNR